MELEILKYVQELKHAAERAKMHPDAIFLVERIENFIEVSIDNMLEDMAKQESGL